jgi:hypothetical protein
MFLIGATIFSSCNKKLKDDIESMEKQVADLKDQQNQTDAILGANEPMTASTKFTDDNGDEKIVTDIYKFKSSDNSTQGLYDNGNGTFTVYIERFSDVDWQEGAVIRFIYNPETKEITDKSVRHYWSLNGPYNDNAYYYDYQTGATINVTINSINISTGNISVNVTASGDEQYSYDYYDQVPNEGSPVTTTLSFSGKLKAFPYVTGSDAVTE